MSCVTVTAEFLPMRLWNSVSIPDHKNWRAKCWPWQGEIAARRKTGKFRVGRMAFAPHKLAYIVYHGLNVEECAELFVVQTCGNRLCCNPTHLSKDGESPAAHRFRTLLIRNEARKQAAMAIPAVRQALPHELAERIARDWVRACMSRREVIETFGVEAWQLDDLKKRMNAGEFRMERWSSQGLQQASGA